MPYRAMQTEIGEPVSVVVQVGRDQNRERRIMEIFEVEEFNPDAGRYEGNTTYTYQRAAHA